MRNNLDSHLKPRLARLLVWIAMYAPIRPNPSTFHGSPHTATRIKTFPLGFSETQAWTNKSINLGELNNNSYNLIIDHKLAQSLTKNLIKFFSFTITIKVHNSSSRSGTKTVLRSSSVRPRMKLASNKRFASLELSKQSCPNCAIPVRFRAQIRPVCSFNAS